MFDEFGYEEDQWRPDKSKIRKIGYKVFAISFVIFVFFLIGLMTTRLFMSKPPASMKEMVWTEDAIKAYNENGNKLSIKHILCSDSFDESRMFSVSTITYCEQIKELQVTVRYNDRVLSYLEEEYPGASEKPETYIFTLFDNFENRYNEYKYTVDHRSGYTYRHLIFSNISLEDVSKLYIGVYYIDDVNFLEDPRHKMYVFKYDFDVLDYTLPKVDAEKYVIKNRPEYKDKAPIHKEDNNSN